MPVLVDGKLSRVHKREILGLCETMSKSRAMRALADILRPINEGLYAPGCAMTFDELWGKWQREILCNYRESTRGFYERTARQWVVPHFKNWPLEDITPLACQQFMNRFGGYSKSVIKHIRASLSRILAGAVDWEYLRTNPAAKIKLPPGKQIKQASVLTVADLTKVIDGLGEPYRTMAVIEAHTGIRESELMALMWTDFDTAQKVMTVQRSVYRGVVGETKNEGSKREIPYGDAIADALQRLEASGHRKGGFLFIATKGGSYNPQRITRLVFKPLAEKLEIPAFTWRSFRRSAATALQVSGIDMATVQKVLGHAEPTMSLHYMDDMTVRRAAIAKLDTLLGAA
jgi:integrase